MTCRQGYFHVYFSLWRVVFKQQIRFQQSADITDVIECVARGIDQALARTFDFGSVNLWYIIKVIYLILF